MTMDRREFAKLTALALPAVAIGLSPELVQQTATYQCARAQEEAEFWTEFRTWDRTVHDVEILHPASGGEELRFVPVRKDLF